MDKRFLFLLFCLLIWVCLSCLAYGCLHGTGNATASHKSSLALIEGNDNIIAETDAAHINFMRSGAEYITPIADEVNGVIDKSVEYLKANPAKALQITGWYTDKENNENTTMENLGVARASHVKRLFVNKGISDNQLAIDG